MSLPQHAPIQHGQVPSVKDFRHRAEMPLIIFGMGLTIIVALISLYIIFIGETLNSFAEGVLVGLVTPMVAAIFIRYHYWNTISNGVEVTERQFPELYTMYRELADRMGFSPDAEGMKKLPRLYIVNGNGALNAFASKCRIKRGYVVLYSDIVDIAYTHGDFNSLRFIMAHELGHIKCGHVSLWRLLLSPVTTALFIAPTVTRAQEYTADRVAAYYAPEDYKGMINLYAGKNLGKQVDLDEYFRTIDDNHSDGFWLLIANFMSNHAVGFRRMKALKDTETAGWNVHGRML